MPVISPKKPYRIGRSRTGLGLFATKRIKKGTKIIRYLGPLLDSKKKKDDEIENKYLFELNNRWTIDGSVRDNVARYINHACKPNAESDVRPRKRKVFIRAIKNIEPGEEINYDYGTDYFKAYLKPIGCKCDACEKKRRKKRAEARAERLRLRAKAERKAQRKAEKETAKRAKERLRAKASKDEIEPDRKRKLESKRPVVLKHKVTNGVRRNGGILARSRPTRPVRSKSVTALPTVPLVIGTEGIAAKPEVAAAFAASHPAIPAAPINEAQQASA
jgi:uncharacterized protein